MVTYAQTCRLPAFNLLERRMLPYVSQQGHTRTHRPSMRAARAQTRIALRVPACWRAASCRVSGPAGAGTPAPPPRTLCTCRNGATHQGTLRLSDTAARAHKHTVTVQDNRCTDNRFTSSGNLRRLPELVKRLSVQRLSCTVTVCLCARAAVSESLSVPWWVAPLRQVHSVRGGGAGVPAPAGPDTRQLAALQHAGTRSAIRV